MLEQFSFPHCCLQYILCSAQKKSSRSDSYKAQWSKSYNFYETIGRKYTANRFTNHIFLYKRNQSSRFTIIIMYMLLSTCLKVQKKNYLFACMRFFLVFIQFGYDPIYWSIAHQEIYIKNIEGSNSVHLFTLHILINSRVFLGLLVQILILSLIDFGSQASMLQDDMMYGQITPC